MTACVAQLIAGAVNPMDSSPLLLRARVMSLTDPRGAAVIRQHRNAAR